jgi:hypothetical protein
LSQLGKLQGKEKVGELSEVQTRESEKGAWTFSLLSGPDPPNAEQMPIKIQAI